MGCISSKGMGRSMSIHERFNQGFHALAIGGDDFHKTTRERDRIITLIKIASGKNLRGFRYVETDTDEISTLCTKPCDLVKPEQDGVDRNRKISKSTELLEISNLGQNAANETADRPVEQGSVSARYRNFHTLEEFEELLEKVKLFEARIVENANSEAESEPVASSTSGYSETCSTKEDDEITSSEGTLSQDTPLVTIPMNKLDAAAGLKRKAMARQLEALLLPISAKAELSQVGSLKEWIHAGDDIYSPETYVTPKFGSYAIERKEFGMFSPELVAAFEECMQQMEAEEIAIVKQMEETFACS